MWECSSVSWQNSFLKLREFKKTCKKQLIAQDTYWLEEMSKNAALFCKSATDGESLIKVSKVKNWNYCFFPTFLNFSIEKSHSSNFFFFLGGGGWVSFSLYSDIHIVQYTEALKTITNFKVWPWYWQETTIRNLGYSVCRY